MGVATLRVRAAPVQFPALAGMAAARSANTISKVVFIGFSPPKTGHVWPHDSPGILHICLPEWIGIGGTGIFSPPEVDPNQVWHAGFGVLQLALEIITGETRAAAAATAIFGERDRLAILSERRIAGLGP